MTCTMQKSEFIEGYLCRIGITEKTLEPTLENLCLIQSQQVMSIPFENTFGLMGKQSLLTKEFLYDKIITNRGGGFCFEVNLLLSYLLIDLGYNVTVLGGAVYSGESAERMDEHVVLKIIIDEYEYIVDTGFGSRTPHYPLPFILDEIFVQDHGRQYRFRKHESDFILEYLTKTLIDSDTGNIVQVGNEWLKAYRFTLDIKATADFKMQHDFHSCNMESLFRREGFKISVITRNGRRTIDGHLLTLYTFSGDNTETSKRVTFSDEEASSILMENFGLAWKQLNKSF